MGIARRHLRKPRAGVRVDLQLEQGLGEQDVDRWVPSACVLCSHGCGLDVAVKDGRIVGVRGRAGDRVNRGRLGPKGRYGWQANNAPDRLTTPLITLRVEQPSVVVGAAEQDLWVAGAVRYRLLVLRQPNDVAVEQAAEGRTRIAAASARGQRVGEEDELEARHESGGVPAVMLDPG